MAVMSMDQFQKKINKWVRDQPSAAERALKIAAEIVRGESVRNHLSGPKMSKGIGSIKSATLQPRTGDLRSSINTKVKVMSNKINATVGSKLKYANRHEKGTFGMPERPFLSSALEKERSKIDNIILKEIMEAYRKP